MDPPVQIVCDEGAPEQLLVDLAEHRVDVVLSDAPVPSGVPIKAYSHLLGASTTTVFGSSELAARYRKNFPASLDGAPFLLPMPDSTLRRLLDEWFDAEKIRPHVAGEFKDRALMKAFGQGGAGLFAAPTAIEAEIREHYHVAVVGRIESVVERYYAISIERRLKVPAVVRITEAARETLFSGQPARV
jgi:LysR family transcriptional activator of nhaA